MAEIKAQGTINLTSVKSVNDVAIDAQAQATASQNTIDNVAQVVDVIQWASSYGEYEASTDGEVQNGKLYFTLNASGQYEAVSSPEGSPAEKGYYELTDMQTTITEYVATHMSFDSHGLWLQTDGESYRLCVTGTGVEIWNQNEIIAQYSTAVVLGQVGGLHIVLDSGELGFYDGSTKVAYVSSNQLYIHDATIENTLQIGNFAFVQRNGRLTLKYVGGN